MLSDAGRLQASKLGERLSGVQFAAAFCSDKQRAIDTAALICRPHHGLVASPTPTLREIDHGHWEGKPQALVQEQFAEEYQRWSADPLSYAPPGGETGLSVLSRALPALMQIVAEHHGQSVLVVSHTGTNRLLLCTLLGIDPRRYRDRIAQDLACLNVIDFVDIASAKVTLLNDTSHYQSSD